MIGRRQERDVGFVPLLYLRGEWRFADRWRFLLDLDALAGGPGRAEDLALKVSYDFAWFNSAVISAAYRF